MIRSLLANKVTAKNEITPNQNSQSINDDQKGAKIFNSLFVNTASILKIAYDELLPQSRDISKTAKHAIKTFENDSSIVAIKKNTNPDDQFSLNLSQKI